MIPLLDLQTQYQSIEAEILEEMKAVLRSGQYILGPYVEKLEQQIAEKIGVNEAISVASGTDALTLTLIAYNIGPKDEVITTPFTFIATAEAISRAGATPVFVDIDPTTGLIDAKKIADKITAKTKAIIPVQLFGQSADMDTINQIAKAHQLIVIEDACQAFGATYKDKPVGSLGDAGCFSFFPTKNLGGIGDGGIVTTNDETVALRLRQLRVHGSDKKYYHREIGVNSRLDAIQAAILLICLKHIDRWNEQRRKLAYHYTQHLKIIDNITCLTEAPDNKHVYHLFCLKSSNRTAIMEALSAHDIASAIYYPLCLHLQEAYQLLNYKLGDLPNAEHLSETIFSVPLHPFLSNEQQTQVIEVIREAAQS
ncbi:DegT/DnrJ/EryC1/StrS family aminotransferase [Amphibacillus cookii]|uniref:DegT/DnrJ/EryC1/StrS family aminotransferase n=1 Tax=Amphibacillus cookii TaxID=767787 RepID=UPI001959CF16|nr:DegT/DnrJ/EryC1/StrS family aminotransferase [Amphibacillus cookii]MBM7542052.1 dTDP-4-amino-4,6-dideoxygalactose transaminase [Amphibacillus cookii]